MGHEPLCFNCFYGRSQHLPDILFKPPVVKNPHLGSGRGPDAGFPYDANEDILWGELPSIDHDGPMP